MISKKGSKRSGIMEAPPPPSKRTRSKSEKADSTPVPQLKTPKRLKGKAADSPNVKTEAVKIKSRSQKRKVSQPDVSTPYVSAGNITECVDALKEYTKSTTKKTQLLDEVSSGNEKVYLQIDFKQVPPNNTTYIHSVRIPHPWRILTQEDVCLITKDHGEERLKDRELDLTQSRKHYLSMIKDSYPEASEVISDIIPFLALKTEYRPNEARHKLARAFDFFLVDKTLVYNKYNLTSRFLGGTFWRTEKKFPVPVNLEADDLRAELERALATVQVFVTGSGTSTMPVIGNLSQDSLHLTENLAAVLTVLHDKYGELIESLRLKTKASIAIPFYADLRGKSNVSFKDKIKVPRVEPLVEDFTLSSIEGTKVAVYPTGDVRLIGRSNRTNDESKKVDEDEMFEQKWMEGIIKEQSDERIQSNSISKKKRQFIKKMTQKATPKKSK